MFSLFAAAAMAILVPLSRSYTATDVASSAQQVVRMAVEIMANDIRLAGLDPTQNADAGILEANATSIRFTSDRVPDGEDEVNGEIDDGNFEHLNYFFDATDNSLKLDLLSPNGSVRQRQSLVDNVSNLRFRYFDREGNETAVLDDVRSVQISMTVTEPAGRGGTVARSYSTRVLCRNL
jgi:hypothetical protein